MLARLILLAALLGFVPLAPPLASAAGKPLTLSLTSVTVTEGQTAILTLSKSGGGRPSLVTWSASDGSASGSLLGSGTIAVPTLDDAIVNGTRTLTVTATASTGARATGTITILDNDAATPAPPPPAPAPEPAWTKCADEGGTCSIAGTADVRYGAGTLWYTKTVTGSIGCDNQTWGDPIYGTVKECDTTGTVASPAPAPAPPPPAPSPSPVPLAVGVTAEVVCSGACSAEYRVDPTLIAGGPGLGYPPGGECDVYRCSVPNGEMVTLLGSALLHDGRVQWQVRSQSQGDVLFFTADELQGVAGP